MKSDNIVKQLQKKELEILKFVDNFCQTNDIPYFLSAGTLLGAIRHKGFIPWDDDIDLGMTRENYERFIQLVPKALKDTDYMLQTYKTDAGYPLPFLKIINLTTTLVESNAKDGNAKNGVFIDIFPFDVVPDNKALRWLQIKKCKLLTFVIHTKMNYYTRAQTPVGGMIYKLLNLFWGRYSVRELLEKRQKEIEKYNQSNNHNMSIVTATTEFRTETLSKTEINDVIRIPFEDGMFLANSNYERMLEQSYGDYMKFPPVEERGTRHDIVYLQLDDFEFGDPTYKKKK
ncbi:LicD family protein [Enterococcus rotai]|uniref:LicD family protein n=1 Tax=Enterococcus rotai TaxID=118060 RepID=UPI0032B32051